MVQGQISTEGVSESSAQAHRLLEDATRLFQRGNAVEARDICRDLLFEHNEYVGAMQLLGRAYTALHDYEAAFPCFSRAAMLSPFDPLIHAQLARSYLDLGAVEMALLTCEQALTMQPEDSVASEVYFLLGRVYAQHADHERAVVHLEKARSLNPELHEAALLHGHCLLEMGERDACAAAYGSIPEGQVSELDRSRMVYDLARHPEAGEAKKLLAQIDALSSAGVKFEENKQQATFGARLELARASVLEAGGDHGAAWTALEAGNALMHGLHAADAARSRELYEHALERASGWTFAGAASAPDGIAVPVSLFILGPSRAGKSTLERLIGTLEGCRPGREYAIIDAAMARTCHAAGLMRLRFPGQLPGSIRETFTDEYIDELGRRVPGATLFTMTQPDVILDLGSIAEKVPNMRVLFIGRDTDDAALRTFGKLYQGDACPHAYDVAEIYRHLESYKKMTDAWSQSLPGLTMRTSYEDMVSDPNKLLSQIAAFCGLPEVKGKLPEVADDRGCAEPFLEHLKRARNAA